MIIEQPSTWLRWLYPSAIWRMPHSERAVYLTFDDGPIPEATPFILDTLDHYGVKATFFMVGDNVRKYPDLKQEIERRDIGGYGDILVVGVDDQRSLAAVYGNAYVLACTTYE